MTEEMISDREIIERLVRIETKVDAQSGTKTAAFAALDKSNTNETELAHIKSQMKLLWGAIITIAGAIVVAEIVSIIRG